MLKHHVYTLFLEKVRERFAVSLGASWTLLSTTFPMIVRIRIMAKSDTIIQADKITQTICTEDMTNIQHITKAHDVTDASTIKTIQNAASKVTPNVFCNELETVLVILEIADTRDRAMSEVMTTVKTSIMGTKGVRSKVNTIVITIKAKMNISIPFRANNETFMVVLYAQFIVEHN